MNRALPFARTLAACALVVLAGCQSGPRPGVARDAIQAELDRALAARDKPAAKPAPDAVAQALLPPLGAEAGAPRAAEPRFDLVVNNAPAAQVFNAIVSGTRFSMLVHPEVSGTISLNLKDVSIPDALSAVRELYGYDYKVQGNRIFVQPAGLQSKIFQVNYLTSQRHGRSETRVSSGSITGTPAGAGAASGASAAAGAAGAAGGAAGATGGSMVDGSQVSTSNQTDFWADLTNTVKVILGSEPGRTVVASPQSGLLIVRALPRELREVENYLRASRLAVERQVMLEAKIVEVVLSEGFQSGINWTALTSARNHRLSSGANMGQFNTPAPALGLDQSGRIETPYSTDAGAFVPNTVGALMGAPLAGVGGRLGSGALSGALGLAFTTNSFLALISFLETQGTVHVLSSPRIATLNNQKAVLKVGTDEFFVTNISTTSTSSGSSTSVSPTITVQPFFSGISLDVTPQIDEDSNIILHIRPSVSVVAEKNKVVNLGNLGQFTLPLASSSMNETDSIVRVQDGNIVAIGGLMEQSQTSDSAKVPGAGDIPLVDNFFRQGKKALQKREFVVLIRPTVIKDDRPWRDDLEALRERIRAQDAPAAAATAPASN